MSNYYGVLASSSGSDYSGSSSGSSSSSDVTEYSKYTVREGFDGKGDNYEHDATMTEVKKSVPFPIHGSDDGWKNCDFNNFREAVNYSLKWCGVYSGGLDNFEVNVKNYFTGHMYIMILGIE